MVFQFVTTGFSQELEPPYRGRHYFIRGEPKSPGPNPDEFSVVLYYKDASSQEEVQIARVDTAHGFTHFDQLYRRDQPKQEVDWDYGEAIEKLIEDWRTYAQSYDNAYG